MISNKLLGVSDLDFTDLTPLANLYTEYPIFIVRPDSSLQSADDLLQRLTSDASGVRTAIATAIGNTNHIALSRVTAHAGGNVKALTIDVFDSARYAIAHVLEGKAELGVITAASAVPELTAGYPENHRGIRAQTTWRVVRAGSDLARTRHRLRHRHVARGFRRRQPEAGRD